METYFADTFCLDELGEWQGVHIPSVRWNGWACPLFTLETCREIAGVINSLDGGETIEVTDDGRIFSVWDFDGDAVERHEVEPVDIDGVDFFPLGSHGWVWDTAND